MASMPPPGDDGPAPPASASMPESPGAAGTGDSLLLVGFDGSHGAATAIDIAAKLLPTRHARVAHLWTSPDVGSAPYRRLAHRAWTEQQLTALVRREAAAAARTVAASGVALAEAAGWSAEPLVREAYGGAGWELARLAEQLRPAAVVVGSRGLGGLRRLLGTVSDLTVHRSPVPVLVVPPLLTEERAATVAGPVIVAHDGSAGADRARAAAAVLLPARTHVITHVDTSVALGPPSTGGEGTDEPGLPPKAITVTAEAFGPGAVADALADEAAAQRAGAIVVGSRGRSMVRETLLGSVARAVLQHGHRPVLVVPWQRVGAGTDRNTPRS